MKTQLKQLKTRLAIAFLALLMKKKPVARPRAAANRNSDEYEDFLWI